MLQSRRGFLIGVGAMLTTAFVKDARSFIHRNSQPLLTSPPQVVETMYWCEIPDEGYQLSLGPWRIAPPPPTWRKFFISESIPHRTESEIERICSSHLIEPGGVADRHTKRISEATASKPSTLDAAFGREAVAPWLYRDCTERAGVAGRVSVRTTRTRIPEIDQPRITRKRHQLLSPGTKLRRASRARRQFIIAARSNRIVIIGI